MNVFRKIENDGFLVIFTQLYRTSKQAENQTVYPVWKWHHLGRGIWYWGSCYPASFFAGIKKSEGPDFGGSEGVRRGPFLGPSAE